MDGRINFWFFKFKFHNQSVCTSSVFAVTSSVFTVTSSVFTVTSSVFKVIFSDLSNFLSCKSLGKVEMCSHNI